MIKLKNKDFLLDKKIAPEFGQKSDKNTQSKHHPAVIEMVKLLARISAENDYNSQIVKNRKKQKKGLQRDR